MKITNNAMPVIETEKEIKQAKKIKSLQRSLEKEFEFCLQLNIKHDKEIVRLNEEIEQINKTRKLNCIMYDQVVIQRDSYKLLFEGALERTTNNHNQPAKVVNMKVV